MPITTFSKTALAIFAYLIVIPFLGEPPFRFGYYLQVEGIIASFWLLGGLAGIWALWITKQKPRLAAKIWALPVVWGWLPIAGLSAILSIFYPIPLQAWTGFGQLGEGILTFFSQAFLTFVLCILSRMRKIRPWILWVTFLSGMIISGLTIIGSSHSPFPSMKYWPWAPIFFPDFIAYIAAAFMGIYLVFIRRYRYHPVFHILFLASIFLISHYSYNITVKYALLIVIATLCILEIKVFKTISYQQKFGTIYIATVLSLTLFIIFYDAIYDWMPQSMAGFRESLIGRTYLNKMTFIDLLHKPFDWKGLLTLLFGKGWGEYGNSLLGNVFLLQDIQLFDGDQWNPSWEFTQRDMLHSHNTLTEHFLALGLVGLGVYLWVKYNIALSFKWQHRFAGITYLLVAGIISIFWFPIIHTFPYLIVANAFVFTRQRPLKGLTLSRLQPFIKIIAPTMVVFTIVHTSFIMLQSKHAFIDRDKDLLEQIDGFMSSPANSYEALEGGRRWVAFIRAYTRSTNDFLEGRLEAEEELFAERSRQMVLDLFRTIPHAGNYYSVLLPMNVYGELASRPRTKEWFENNPELLKEWDNIAQEFITHLPFRTDILIPYLNYLMFHGQGDKGLQFIEHLLNSNPLDPVGLWFKGTLTLMKGEDRQAGICALKAAIAQKISRYMPIPPEEIDRIKNAFVVCPALH
jgi:hypothetical protein